jgi:hypothetical protein
MSLQSSNIPNPSQHRSNRPGMAVPMAILSIAVMTIALMTGFMLISSERRTVDDQQAQVRALGIAQQGLDAYLRHPENPTFRPGRTVHMPPWSNDTAWVPVNTRDTAIVIPKLFRTSTLVNADTMYVISSLGYLGGKYLRGTPTARRAVAEMATWTMGATLPIKAGWMSLSGIQKNGVSGTLSGNDDASPPCGGPGNVAGVSVPTAVPSGAGYQGPLDPLSGNPPLDNTTLGLTPATAADSMKKSGIDWLRWSQGLDIPNVWRTADHGGTFPSFSNPASYPIVYVSGNLPDLPTGRGLLIVSGNLTINGSTSWDGIILVGGGVTANGNNNVQGAVLSGLNAIIDPTSVPIASLGNGTKTIQYNSCEVKKAMAGMRALVPRRGTWVDNWATF